MPVLFTPVLPGHRCLAVSFAQTLLRFILSHKGLPQVSVVEKVRQLFPSTGSVMTVMFPLKLCRKQPEVEYTKLRSSPDPAHKSFKCALPSQTDEQICDLHLLFPRSSQDNTVKTSFLPD